MMLVGGKQRDQPAVDVGQRLYVSSCEDSAMVRYSLVGLELSSVHRENGG